MPFSCPTTHLKCVEYRLPRSQQINGLGAYTLLGYSTDRTMLFSAITVLCWREHHRLRTRRPGVRISPGAPRLMGKRTDGRHPPLVSSNSNSRQTNKTSSTT